MNNSKKLLERVVDELIGLSKVVSNSHYLSPNRLLALKNIIERELLLKLDYDYFVENLNQSNLLDAIEILLPRDSKGNTIITLFSKFEDIAKEELHHAVKLKWFMKWDDFYKIGNFFTSPDYYDFIEMFVRIEELFEINIKASSIMSESQFGETVGETTKTIWLIILKKHYMRHKDNIEL